jgi:hypothetical protein
MPIIKQAQTFTTDGTGTATIFTGAAAVDVWLDESGFQGILVPHGTFTYNSVTGVISGLEANKKYLAYGR